MRVYETSYKILSSDTDLHQRLRLSRLCTLLQEAAIAHTEILGAGREKTLDRGYLWVIATQQIRVIRLPRYDEEITLTSVPGDVMHTFFPRYYRIADRDGNEILNASALWALMNQKTRTMMFPDKIGVRIDGEKPAWQSFLPRPPKLPADGTETVFTVPYSYTDLNGHMNNTRYLDLAEDLMPDHLRRLEIRDVTMEFTGEAKLNDRLNLSFRAAADEFLLTGAADKRLFRLGLKYELPEDA